MFRKGDLYELLVKFPDGKYIRYQTEIFVNAWRGAEKFAKQLGIETGLFPCVTRLSLPSVSLCWVRMELLSICLSIP